MEVGNLNFAVLTGQADLCHIRISSVSSGLVESGKPKGFHGAYFERVAIFNCPFVTAPNTRVPLVVC